MICCAAGISFDSTAGSWNFPCCIEFYCTICTIQWISKIKRKLTYLLTYLLTSFRTYLLTPWSVVLEKLTVSQLVKKISEFYGIKRFITAFTGVLHLSLYWATSIQSMPSSHFPKTHLNIILPSTPGSSKWCLSPRFSHWNPVYASPLPITSCTITWLHYFMVKGKKVQLSLLTHWRRTWGAAVLLHLFLTLALIWSEFLTLHPGCFNPVEELRYPLNRRLDGLQNLSGPFKNENFLCLRTRKRSIFQRVRWGLCWLTDTVVRHLKKQTQIYIYIYIYILHTIQWIILH